MNVRATILSCWLAVAAVAPCAAGQSTNCVNVCDGDSGAWTAMMLTPAGALPAIMVSPGGGGAQRVPTWAFRFSSWKFGADRSSNFGATVVAPVASKASFAGTLAFFKPGGGGDGTVMLGGDLETPFWESVKTANNPMTFSALANGGLGYGRFLGKGGGNLLSLVGSVPLGLHYAMANKSAFTAMVSPGFGFGSVSGGVQSSQSGTRPMISLGAAWMTPTGVGIHAGMDKVMVHGDPPWVWGFAISVVPGGK
jgi:hypothetical protein